MQIAKRNDTEPEHLRERGGWRWRAKAPTGKIEWNRIQIITDRTTEENMRKRDIKTDKN